MFLCVPLRRTVQKHRSPLYWTALLPPTQHMVTMCPPVLLAGHRTVSAFKPYLVGATHAIPTCERASVSKTSHPPSIQLPLSSSSDVTTNRLQDQGLMVGPS